MRNIRQNTKMASSEEVLVWTPELEVSLFHSMKGHKPVGKAIFLSDSVFL